MSDAFDCIEETLAKLHRSDPYNVFTWLSPSVSENKKLISDRIYSGNAGVLAGFTCAVKDNIHVLGMPTTCASEILKDYYPPWESTAVHRLREEDLLIIGKTNMDEFAMGSSTEYSIFGATDNPILSGMVAGGSSGGSAAAVAAGYVDFALGSDTGGSVRLPAAFCGITGLKPTYGRVSRYGLVAFASSLDQIGILARDCRGCALVLKVIAGKDEHDATVSDHPVSDYLKIIDRTLPDLTIGYLDNIEEDEIEKTVLEEYLEFINQLKIEGFRLKGVKLHFLKYSVAAYHIISSAEAASNLLRYDGVRYGKSVENKKRSTFREMIEKTRRSGFGEEVKRRILTGAYVLCEGYYQHYYQSALKVRRIIRNEFLDIFNEVDLLVTPVSPVLPFPKGTLQKEHLKLYQTDRYLAGVNLGGFPALSVPIRKAKNGMPVGIQLIGKYFDEETILQLGHFIGQFN